MSRFFSVKNWRQFQHYGDRSPKWIKLHGSSLDDYEFTQLPDFAKWHLVGIWLLASKMDNRIPWDGTWISGRIGSSSPVDLDALAKAGFIFECGDDAAAASAQPHGGNDISDSAGQNASGMLAARSETASLEKEKRERREERDSPPTPPPGGRRGDAKTYSDDFQAFWKAYPHLPGNPKEPAWAEWQKAVLDVDPQTIIAAAKRYAEASAKKDAPKVAHARTWLFQRRWNDWGWPESGALTPEERAVKEAEMYRRALERRARGFTWPDWLGPPPGAPGCRVPVEILAAHGPLRGGGATPLAAVCPNAPGGQILGLGGKGEEKHDGE